MMARDEAHPLHSGCQPVNLIHLARCLQVVVAAAQIQDFELVGVTNTELRVFDVKAAYPLVVLPEIGDQMVFNEAAGTGNEDFRFLKHNCDTPWVIPDQPAGCTCLRQGMTVVALTAMPAW